MVFSRLVHPVWFRGFLLSALLLSLFACAAEEGSSADLKVLGVRWTAPSLREDNSALALSEIASFRVYYGTAAGDYQGQLGVEDSSAVQASIVDLPPGTYYVVVTVVDVQGQESLYSSELTVTI